MKVLFCTSEVVPLVKTGGLADVSGALPVALGRIGVDCRVLLPGYPQVLENTAPLEFHCDLTGLPGQPTARLLRGALPGSDTCLYVLDVPAAYDRPGGPYQDTQGEDHADNAWRFALLAKAAALLASPLSPLGWRPRVLHCNDWPTGLAPAYLHFMGVATPSLMTVHNLAYQGIFPREVLPDLELPPESFSIDGVEYYGNLSLLKAGLYYAGRLSTVSPTYAREIQRSPLGMGLEGLLASRAGELTGILNGIDSVEWDPAADPHLSCAYSARDLSDKRHCKQALQARMGLQADPDAPLFGLIARMTHQKGLDLVLDVVDGIVHRGGQLVLLGTGDAAIERAVRDTCARHPGRVACLIGYDEALSHQIEAGADAFLMPSRFEPCGLNQMYSLRYGTVPIVHATGGLADTVEDGVTGFVFREPSAHALWLALEQALTLYADRAAWRRLMKNGMQQDFSWQNSAQSYLTLYRGMV
ncbi:MAG TPA: glycogen synthase GlgA [Thiobacillaceae bacterium]|nr:glycogen synthase GlgA [Thiobacillaceae bacterium]HNU63406.1 glycogen synthase GlgA [Thiobacillaceae bacterium]